MGGIGRNSVFFNLKSGHGSNGERKTIVSGAHELLAEFLTPSLLFLALRLRRL